MSSRTSRARLIRRGVSACRFRTAGVPVRRACEDRAATHPWLVAERDGVVAGFAYGSPHRERAAYRWAVDVAVYVDREHLGHSVGRRLYAALLPQLRDQGFHVACAGMTLPNDASVGLHESFGFEPVGVYRAIGFKAGAWRDVGWWQLALRLVGDSDEPGASPPEPRPPFRAEPCSGRAAATLSR